MLELLWAGALATLQSNQAACMHNEVLTAMRAPHVQKASCLDLPAWPFSCAGAVVLLLDCHPLQCTWRLIGTVMRTLQQSPAISTIASDTSLI